MVYLLTALQINRQCIVKIYIINCIDKMFCALSVPLICCQSLCQLMQMPVLYLTLAILIDCGTSKLCFLFICKFFALNPHSVNAASYSNVPFSPKFPLGYFGDCFLSMHRLLCRLLIARLVEFPPFL